jgi:hypothetical protein
MVRNRRNYAVDSPSIKLKLLTFTLAFLFSAGDLLFSDRKDNTKLYFDSNKTSCAYIENGQTLVHGRGGRGYGVSSSGFSSG